MPAWVLVVSSIHVLAVEVEVDHGHAVARVQQLGDE
jgi:hypothetical protein